MFVQETSKSYVEPLLNHNSIIKKSKDITYVILLRISIIDRETFESYRLQFIPYYLPLIVTVLISLFLHLHMFRGQNVSVMKITNACILRVESYLYLNAHLSFRKRVMQHFENTFKQFHFKFQVHSWNSVIDNM